MYADSLVGEFENNYRSKCLQAYKNESFTVSHTVSEYHYTLYYYDQAGNLVKTIAPKGVNPNRNTVWLDEIKTKRAAGQTQVPSHAMPTQYRYNTLNQVVAQQTPDAGKSEFWYDRLGRLALSQNAKQRAVSATATNRLYSYTKYDVLGRITEVGQLKDNTGATTVDDLLTRNAASLEAWLTARETYRAQFTTTVYDLPYDGFTGIDARLAVQQRHLRNRVSFTSYSDTTSGLDGTAFSQATYYSYDIHGNVDTLVQDYGVPEQFANLMNKNGNRFKKIIYNYDLISGKVNKVSYQKGWADQVFHRYHYDAENRLTEVETSFDDRHWEKDAQYAYYRHGPLARTVLGAQQVQGIDYAYTLQGWLKGVNSSLLLNNTDMGEDGLAASIHQFTARDAIGFNLNYYDTSDYAAISGSNPFPGTMAYLPSAQYRPLFNGNISSMVVHNRALKTVDAVNSPMMLYTYHYDQLNRITQMDAYKKADLTTNNWAGLTGMNQYKEFVTYDPNGNILKYRRHGHKGSYIMDSLTYIYDNNTNRLNWVKDVTPSSRYGADPGDVADIDNQAVNNYGYDEIGNLIKDTKEGIASIRWSVYGKILEINRTASTANAVQKIRYTYDAQGNRISKEVLKNNGNKTYTWYVRDAQGNVMATYTSSGSPTNLASLPLSVSERHLYGSSRLGMYMRQVNVDEGPADMSDSNSVKYYRGFRQYELSNHLGNVLATISDKKKPFDTNSDGNVDYFDADVTTAQDYYPFGMLMPGRIGYQSATGWVSDPGEPAPDNGLAADIAIDTRTGNEPPEYTATNSVELTPGFESGAGDQFLAYISEANEGSGGGSEGSSLNGGYRYGFNGKENDNEVKGTGNQQDYGMRIYDPRLGRFLSVDPLTKSYPMLTPYQFASNRPIDGIDLDGLEYLPYQKSMYRLQHQIMSSEVILGNGTKQSVTNSSTIVNTVYENIPAALQDAKNLSFKYVSGGPVTAYGRDWNTNYDGDVVSQAGKYYYSGPKFYGAAEGGKSTSGINSLKGNATQGTMGTAQSITGVAGAVGPNGLGGMFSNWMNAKTWNALGKESEYRQRFYAASNLVDYSINNNLIGDQSLLNEVGRTNLVNFLTDGYLPTASTDKFSGSKYSTLRQDAYGRQLSVAYTGLQLMRQNGIEIRKETKAAIQDLLNKYKSDGGGNKYDNIQKLIAPN